MGDVAPWQERDPNQEDEDDDIDENVVSDDSIHLTRLAIPGSEGCRPLPYTSFAVYDQTE